MTEKTPGKRILLSSEATYRLAGGVTPPVSVMVNELSSGGLKFVTTNKLPVGIGMDLNIQITEKSDPINAQAAVVEQIAISSKFLFNTTVEFTEISARDKSRLDSFLTYETENIKMGRAHLRCAMTGPVRCRYVDQPAKIISCFSGDISVLGIKLFVKQQLGVGKEIFIGFELPLRRTEMQLKGKIVWEKESMGSVWATGVKFIAISAQDQDHIVRFINYSLNKG